MIYSKYKYENKTAIKLVTFLATFFGAVISGLVILFWVFPVDEQFNKIAVPGLFFGAFIFASISALQTK